MNVVCDLLAEEPSGSFDALPQVSQCVLRPVTVPSDAVHVALRTEAASEPDDWQSTLFEYFAAPRVLAEGQVCAVLSSTVLRRDGLDISPGGGEADVERGRGDADAFLSEEESPLGPNSCSPQSGIHSPAPSLKAAATCHCLTMTPDTAGLHSPLFVRAPQQRAHPVPRPATPPHRGSRASSFRVDERSAGGDLGSRRYPRGRRGRARPSDAPLSSTTDSNLQAENRFQTHGGGRSHTDGGGPPLLTAGAEETVGHRVNPAVVTAVRACPGGEYELSSLSTNVFLALEWDRKVQHCLRWFVVESLHIETDRTAGSDSCATPAVSPPVGVVSRDSTKLLLGGRPTPRRLIPFAAYHLLWCPPPTVLPPLRAPLARFLSFASSLVSSPSHVGGGFRRAGILLKGTRGCGKRILARLACQRLGFHYKELDGLAISQLATGASGAAGVYALTCCTRLGGAETHIDDSVAPGNNSPFSAALVEAASEATPVLIHIRRLQALYHPPTGETPSEAEVNRLQARLANHLRWFLTAHGCWLERCRQENWSGAGAGGSYEGAEGDPVDQTVLVVASLRTEASEDTEEPSRGTANQTRLTPEFTEAFDLVIRIQQPDNNTLQQVATDLLKAVRGMEDAHGDPVLQVSPAEVATICAGLSVDDVKAVFSKVLHEKAHFLRRAKTHAPAGPPQLRREGRASSCASEAITAEDFQQAAKGFLSGSLDSTIPGVEWRDVGGMDTAKNEIRDYISLPLQHPELFEGVKTRGGILLFGPPGTGKTLLAKAVATECGVNFISVKGPELLNMYIGESERNVRKVFQQARACKPSVLFFDELDALLPRRGRSSDSGGVLDRVVSQLLAEIDGLPSNVFLIGATNRVELIDKAVLRAGRLDRCVYVGLQKNRLPLLEALTRRMTLEDSVHYDAKTKASTRPRSRPLLQRVDEALPPQFTGADCKALCSTAGLMAVKETINFVDAMSKALQISPLELQELLQDFEAAYKPVSKALCRKCERFPAGLESPVNYPDADAESCCAWEAEGNAQKGDRTFPLRCQLLSTAESVLADQLRIVLLHDRPRAGDFTDEFASACKSFQVWRILDEINEEAHSVKPDPASASQEIWCTSTMSSAEVSELLARLTSTWEGTGTPELVLEPLAAAGRLTEGKNTHVESPRSSAWRLNGSRAFLWKGNSHQNTGERPGQADGGKRDAPPAQALESQAQRDDGARSAGRENKKEGSSFREVPKRSRWIPLQHAVPLSGAPPHELLHVKVGERHFRAALAQTRPSLSTQELLRYEKTKHQYESVPDIERQH
ncbi:hypothetical protein BESB_083670 [Besnoitia besnoiti]|uniref:Peroxisomal ATPase PEX6 n=1 Tax=Besnoitia besnoiti TaxID=94643 RepID=A0A2A9M3V7_BESBE|nr:hypothetical protein BESB_083670 [Besnoitia besnoiti]PFH33168.1 hypothetical protein BESB_083670 [Besnoitia besnoiti]